MPLWHVLQNTAKLIVICCRNAVGNVRAAPVVEPTNSAAYNDVLKQAEEALKMLRIQEKQRG